MISQDSTRQMVDSAIAVDWMKIAIAKSYILANLQESVPNLIDGFLREQGFPEPPTVVINESVDLASQVQRAAEYVALRLAACEALWGLIYAGILVRKDSGSLWDPPINIQWTTIVGKSGGMSSGWSFETCRVPNFVTLSPSARYTGIGPLSDSDLYLRDIGVPDMHTEVVESLRSAVQCFHTELYLPAIVMLARAIEGAWIEFGRALVDATPPQAGKDGVSFAQVMSEPEISLARLIEAARLYYGRKDLWNDVWKRSGMHGFHIDGAATWSDHVRARRNVVHYNSTETFPYTYETVGPLLLAATQYLRVIYDARRALVLPNP